MYIQPFYNKAVSVTAFGRINNQDIKNPNYFTN